MAISALLYVYAMFYLNEQNSIFRKSVPKKILCCYNYVINSYVSISISFKRLISPLNLWSTENPSIPILGEKAVAISQIKSTTHLPASPG